MRVEGEIQRLCCNAVGGVAEYVALVGEVSRDTADAHRFNAFDVGLDWLGSLGGILNAHWSPSGNIVPDDITLDQAVELIEARAQKTGAKPAPRRRGPRKADARVAKPAEGQAATKPKKAPAKKKAAKSKKTVVAAE